MHSYSELESALSLERFGRYLAWSNGDRPKAIALYTLNTQVSESLYTPLQMLEVALRNRIHTVMTGMKHENWFHEDGVLKGDYQVAQLTAAVNDIELVSREATSSRIVAALTFSFWTAMFGKDYETLWQQGLHKIAQRPDGKGLRRKDFSTRLYRIRTLRNRVAHHEPIIGWDLHKTHEMIVQLVEWLSPPAAHWCSMHSRFMTVYPVDTRHELQAPAEVT